MQSSDPQGQPWLTLQEASERLSVHPATLRHSRPGAGADLPHARRPPPLRGPGRRGAARGRAGPPGRARPAAGRRPGPRQARAAGGRLAAQPWHRLLDPAASLPDARALAREQGRFAWQRQLALPDVVRTYTLFRDMVLESALQVRAVQDPGASARDLARVHRRVGSLLDEALVACVEAYSEAAG